MQFLISYINILSDYRYEKTINYLYQHIFNFTKKKKQFDHCDVSISALLGDDCHVTAPAIEGWPTYGRDPKAEARITFMYIF